MSLEDMLQPLGEVFFPMSHAVVGSVIPGILRRYPVKIVNYPNFEQAVVQRVGKPFDPVKRFPEKEKPSSVPDMKMEHGKAHPIMEKLKQMMGARPAVMRPGYERIKEDLSWRGRSGPQIKSV